MATVYLLQAEHFEVAGRITKIFADKHMADREACDLANQMRIDTDFEDMPPPATPDDWQALNNWLQEVHGAAHCYVEVDEHPVISPSFRITIAWNNNDPSEGDYSDTVEAAEAEEAEKIVRKMMACDDMLKRQNFTYGRLIECVEV